MSQYLIVRTLERLDGNTAPCPFKESTAFSLFTPDGRSGTLKPEKSFYRPRDRAATCSGLPMRFPHPLVRPVRELQPVTQLLQSQDFAVIKYEVDSGGLFQRSCHPEWRCDSLIGQRAMKQDLKTKIFTMLKKIAYIGVIPIPLYCILSTELAFKGAELLVWLGKKCDT